MRKIMNLQTSPVLCEGSERENICWSGSSVSKIRDSLEGIQSVIPFFSSQPFGTPHKKGYATNPNLYEIIREPLVDVEKPVPVGVVSGRYELIQHHTVLKSAADAVEQAGIQLKDTELEVWITQFAERMALNILFPEGEEYSMNVGDSGDSMRLRLQCFNSVDGSLKFMAFLGWFRFICSNGLIMTISKVNVKKRHDSFLKIDDLKDVIAVGLTSIKKEKRQYELWRNTNVEMDIIRKWVDGPLKEKWGVRLAARAFHIVNTARDAEFANPFEKGKPSEKTLISGSRVAGISDETVNVFTISQILSWLAKERRDIQEQVACMRDIPILLEILQK
jgi:hypothetical protein